jgi:hypothetical protein
VFSDLHINLLYPIRLRQRTYAEQSVLNWSSGFVIKKLILPSIDLRMFSTDMVSSPFFLVLPIKTLPFALFKIC